MEKAFTAHGKAGAFPHPVNAVSHSSIVRPVIHISTAPTTANIHPFFPAWIKENKSIKNREYSHHHASGNCTPFLCLEKWRKSTLFPILFSHSKAEGKSYCLCILSLTEPKNPLFSTLFPPLLRKHIVHPTHIPASFLSYLSGREDRQQFRLGNSACSYGYIFGRFCCTAVCRSPQERSSIPVSTFYFGS